MHYSKLELQMYRNGMLSVKLNEEIENHLRECDECLKTYLETLEDNKAEEKTTIKKIKKHKKSFAILASLVIIFTVFFQTPIGNKVMASIKHNFDEITLSLSEAFGFDSKNDDYIYKSNLIATSNGVSIQLKEYTIEKNSIRLLFLIKGDEISSKEANPMGLSFYINGKEPEYLSGNAPIGSEKDFGVFPLTLDFPGNDISTDKDDNFRVEFDKVIYYDYENLSTKQKELEGSWIFEFTGNASDLENSQELFPLDLKKKVDSTNFIVNHLKINKMYQSFIVNEKYPVSRDYPRFLEFEIEDDKGNITTARPFNMVNGESNVLKDTVHSEHQYKFTDNFYENIKNSKYLKINIYTLTRGDKRAEHFVKDYILDLK